MQIVQQSPSHKYSFRNISENTGIENRALGNIKAGILQMKPKYTVIPFENKKSHVMNGLEGKCAVTLNVPINRYETRVACNLGKYLSE